MVSLIPSLDRISRLSRPESLVSYWSQNTVDEAGRAGRSQNLDGNVRPLYEEVDQLKVFMISKKKHLFISFIRK